MFSEIHLGDNVSHLIKVLKKKLLKKTMAAKMVLVSELRAEYDLPQKYQGEASVQTAQEVRFINILESTSFC